MDYREFKFDATADVHSLTIKIPVELIVEPWHVVDLPHGFKVEVYKFEREYSAQFHPAREAVRTNYTEYECRLLRPDGSKLGSEIYRDLAAVQPFIMERARRVADKNQRDVYLGKPR